MTSLATRLIWGGLALGAVICVGLALPVEAENQWIVFVVGFNALLTLAGLLPATTGLVARPVVALRARPLRYWLLLLVYIAVALGAWAVDFQPTNGRPLRAIEYAHLLASAGLLLYLTNYSVTREQLQMMGDKIGSSPLTGAMITLTTVVIILIGAEAYLRIFYITTDGYGFTAMNYHWYQNFGYAHDNSLGYRDYEPQPDAETRIAVVGDSFAMGHGINNIDDTFPQIIERELGDSYDVNVIAESGWDSNVQVYRLDDYPYEPDIVILSYYLNDIDHLLGEPSLNPNGAFRFPTNPVSNWIVLNFFVPNYIYYNIVQFTSPQRQINFTERLVGSYLDDDLWAMQAWHLNEIYEWTEAHDAQLIALIWPQMAAVEESIPATVRVRDFFLERDVLVVDMTEDLLTRNPREMIVNRFDAHPGIPAQRIAAEQLLTVLRSP